MPAVKRLKDADWKPASLRISTIFSACGKASMVRVR